MSRPHNYPRRDADLMRFINRNCSESAKEQIDAWMRGGSDSLTIRCINGVLHRFYRDEIDQRHLLWVASRPPYKRPILGKNGRKPPLLEKAYPKNATELKRELSRLGTNYYQSRQWERRCIGACVRKILHGEPLEDRDIFWYRKTKKAIYEAIESPLLDAFFAQTPDPHNKNALPPETKTH